MASDSPASPPALDYAAGPPARRRLLRRAARLWPAWLLLLLVGLGIAYGPWAWTRYRVHRLQEACMTAALPRDRPVCETDPAAARALVAARPGGYRLDRSGWAIRPDPRWAALATELGVPAPASATTAATVFVGERFTPSGARRLVVIQHDGGAAVIEPGGWTRPPRVAWRGVVRAWEDDPAQWAALEPKTTFAGTADPADGSRWTVGFTLRGVPGTWEYRLYDDGRISKYLVDPTAFAARLEAAQRLTPAPPPDRPATPAPLRDPGIGGE
ncbi:MAG TPA: hypothetical protein VEA69_12910 [Tepidisphaeraceae bacterium]|nr:hypothetical protein [Tepidisphaeraceae bacterium]